jgi:hypothetical protein
MDPDNFARRWNKAANGLNEIDRVRAGGLYQSQFRDKLINRIGQLQDKLLEEAEVSQFFAHSSEPLTPEYTQTQTPL